MFTTVDADPRYGVSSKGGRRPGSSSTQICALNSDPVVTCYLLASKNYPCYC